MDREFSELAAFAERLSRKQVSLRAEGVTGTEGRPSEPAGRAYGASSPYSATIASPYAEMENRVGQLADEVTRQWRTHEEALRNTNRVFDKLLAEMELVSGCFRNAMGQREMEEHRVQCEIDADRSVGILKVFWHAMSFTTRGNTKPMAIFRHGVMPAMAGRIVALMGDFQELGGGFSPGFRRFGGGSDDFPDLLNHEIASLYVPADPTARAVMRVKHLGDEEHYFTPSEAPRQFLLKVVELVCAGGYFHESDSY